MRLLRWGIGLSLMALCPALILSSGFHERQECLRVYQHPCNIWEDSTLKSPLKSRPHAGAGYLDMQHKRYQAALTQFGTVYDLSYLTNSSHDAEVARLNAETNIAHILQIIGENEKAESYLRDAWLENPGFPPFAVGLSFYDIQHGKFNEAMAIITDALNVGIHKWGYALDLSGGALYLNRGAIYEAQGNCVLANQDYARAVKFPDVPHAVCVEKQK